ncbi:threonine synthase-like 2 isoform X2 [Tiliqua scincoides]|uniref:threonine synthase-like 2 isoform X2 n=1 Tax=Tiliqua scincoides TaxID=71010 RepID=UPI003462152E
MRYISTRGGAESVDFEGALFSGYAADGGLFMPEKIPVLDYATLQKWSTFSYPELVEELCSIFISPELIPKAELNGQFLQYFLKKKKKHVTILVGTSGDTGSAAIESVRGEKNMDIFVLLPHGLCSQVQELQMTTVIEENVHVFLAEGNSDEIDKPIKELFADEDFSRRHKLMSLNSINWSRILVQMAHYFYAYFQCAPSMDAPPLPVVEIIVPTGAGGNLTAGYIAKKMGLPIELVAAVNDNNIVHRAIQHGDFSLSGSVKSTPASAMDILEPYNMERIFWLISGSDSNLIKSLMEEFYTTKKVKLPEELQKKLSKELTSCSVSEEEIIQTMRHCWEDNHYLLCPHTAVAVCCHYNHPSCRPSMARCSLAPASSVKFSAAVLKAGLTLEASAEISALKEMETRSSKLKKDEDWAEILRHRIEAVTRQRNRTLS